MTGKYLEDIGFQIGLLVKPFSKAKRMGELGQHRMCVCVCNRASWPRASNIIVIIVVIVIIIISIIICILLLAKGGSHREGMGGTLRHGHLDGRGVGWYNVHPLCRCEFPEEQQDH